jgi:ATP-binding cassette, subfamily C, bacterial CydCD
MRPFDPRLLRYARRAAMPIAVLGALGVAATALIIVQARLLATVIASTFIDKATPAIGTALAALAAVAAGRALAAWAAQACAHRASANAKSQLRRRLLSHVVRLGPAWQRQRNAAELTALATTGLDALDGYFTGYLPALIGAVVVPLAVLATIAAADPLSGVVVAATLPLVPVFGALTGMAAGRRAAERLRALGTLAHHFLDVVTGLPTLRVFGRATAQRQQIAKVTDRYRRATMGALRLAFLSSFAVELIATMSVALVATEIGLRLAYGHLDLRTGLFVLILAPEAYLPLRSAGAQFHAAADGLAAAGQVFAVLETPAPAPRPAPARGSLALVTVDHVTVHHEGRAEPSPRDATLTIAPGRITVLTGPSGCGKSTLLQCILGFREPDSGVIDSAFSPDDLGWLPQHPVLFTGTVASNIRLGWPAAPRAVVERAAREAALDDVPLDRVTGEGGGGLSAGQLRRVALARALLPRRPVLLLDEPTAGLDAAREAAVAETLRARAADGAAVLVVSHRPAVIAAADEVADLAARGAPESTARETPAGALA